MLRLALTLLVIALIAGLFAFDLVADFSWDSGRVVVFVLLLLAAVLFVADGIHERPVDTPEPI